MNFKALVHEDLKVNFFVAPLDYSISLFLINVLQAVIISSGFRAMLLYRLAYSANEKRMFIWAQLFSRMCFATTMAQISYRAKIGPGLSLPHPFGVIIGGNTTIGVQGMVGQHVTLGGNMDKKSADGREYPTIGNHVMILAGAVIGGPVEIGDNVIIGANCVVTQSIPAGHIVKNSPIQIIERNR
jgi:serine O-acetyltransferase